MPFFAANFAVFCSIVCIFALTFSSVASYCSAFLIFDTKSSPATVPETSELIDLISSFCCFSAALISACLCLSSSFCCFSAAIFSCLASYSEIALFRLFCSATRFFVCSSSSLRRLTTCSSVSAFGSSSSV